MKLFVGPADSREPIHGPCCTSAARMGYPVSRPSEVLLDSGAFSETQEARLTFEEALARQFRWEKGARRKFGRDFCVDHFVAYDALMPSFLKDGDPEVKRIEGEKRLAMTQAAAEYFDSRRARIEPRTLVLPIQGYSVDSYVSCCKTVLDAARPGDWLGLGGWCRIGQERLRWRDFRKVVAEVTWRTKRAGLRHIHLFGVLWLSALATFQWYCDEHGLSCSTDSTLPANAFWRYTQAAPASLAVAERIEWWRARVADLRDHEDYRH
jgi:hypothetical protein